MFDTGKLIIKNKSLVLYAALIIISAVSMSISLHGDSFKPKEFGGNVLAAGQLVFDRIGGVFSGTVNSISELRILKMEYEDLRKRMSDYQAIERDMVELRRENLQLRELLGFSESIPYQHIAAQIIAKDPSSIFSSFTINRGSDHGIKLNMPVVAYHHGFQGLVGRVADVTGKTSLIIPVLDQSCYVAARIQDSRYEGLVNGLGVQSDYIEMRYVMKRAKADIQEGDLVVTSGLGSIYPEGIFIGRIRKIEAPEWQPSLELYIEPVIDFSRLHYVFVLDQITAEISEEVISK